jgi:transposase
VYKKDMKKLTDNEIKRRMVEWRNLQVLHKKAVARNEKFKRKLSNANGEIRVLKEVIAEQLELNEQLQLRVEELELIIFGRKKKKKKKKSSDDDNKPKGKKGSGKPRDKESYKREVPRNEDVTTDEYHELDPNCPDCGSSLEDKETTVFYEEDIPLPDDGTKLKQVIRHHVDKGWCPNCRKWHSAIPLPTAKIVMGWNVKLYIIYLSILLRLSFSQIRYLLWDTYHFKISQGEVSYILHRMGDKLRPVFERLKKKLQASKGVHLDETGWCMGLYLWVMAAIEEEDVLYLAGRTRGKGNADELLGEDFKGVRITDGYTAYNHQSGKRQQCWAHPNRKLRELSESKSINEDIRLHCEQTFAEFGKIYASLREYIAEPFQERKRRKQKNDLLDQIREWRRPDARDPKKLKNIKIQFEKYEPEWLTCMDYEGIPCDNNKAERKLRHFVIKRKISFGNRSKRGHETFEVLASVLMTTWKNHQDSFFPQLKMLFA